MRCPKCQYIGFEDGDRCRNCGYSFALAEEPGPVDLPMRLDTTPGPFGDFDLGGSEPRPDDRAAAPLRSAVMEGRSPSSDLPLFFDERADRSDVPLVNVPPFPRPPIAVRRSHGTLRPRDRGGPHDQPLLDIEAEADEEARLRLAEPSDADREERPGHGTPAGLFARTVAGLIDLSLVVGVQAGVVYLTLRVCGLQLEEIRRLPPAPMIAFLLLLAGGYFASFVAAAGQTIGKMAAGIRVVPMPESDPGTGRVPLGNAIVRAAVSFVSLLPAGAGLVPALISADRRTLHDRLAETRVVKN
jgi:uncharacterized RDD family membrane protein YckC